MGKRNRAWNLIGADVVCIGPFLHIREAVAGSDAQPAAQRASGMHFLSPLGDSGRNVAAFCCVIGPF